MLLNWLHWSIDRLRLMYLRAELLKVESDGFLLWGVILCAKFVRSLQKNSWQAMVVSMETKVWEDTWAALLIPRVRAEYVQGLHRKDYMFYHLQYTHFTDKQRNSRAVSLMPVLQAKATCAVPFSSKGQEVWDVCCTIAKSRSPNSPFKCNKKTRRARSNSGEFTSLKAVTDLRAGWHMLHELCRVLWKTQFSSLWPELP